MSLARREFVGSLAAFAAVGFGRVFSAPAGVFARGTPNLTFGLLSDIHIRFIPSREGRPGFFNSQVLRRSFSFFAKENVDAVVIAGDLADSGLCDELQEVAASWRAAFPDNRAADGRPVEKVFVFGNHDDSWTFARRNCKNDDEARARALCVDRTKWWKEILDEEFQPVYRKTIKGYDFIGVHWYKGVCRGKGDAHNAEIRPFYEKVGPTLDPKKPFFHIQHPHPRDTVHGPTVWGQDDGTAGEILSHYPQAIALSGHSHNSLLDDRAVWQGAFTSVATATGYTVGASGLSDVRPADGFENDKSGRSDVGAAHRRVMAPYNQSAVQQGQVVRVYDDRIVFSRYDLADMSPLADDLVLPLSGERPFAFGPRRAVAKSPVFPADAALVVKTGTARRRDAKKDEVPVPTLEITIPAANGEPSAPGVWFEVVATGTDGASRRFGALHDAWRCGAASPRARAPLRFSVPLDRLPEGEVSLAVTAHSWWGLSSRPLTTVFHFGDRKGA